MNIRIFTLSLLLMYFSLSKLYVLYNESLQNVLTDTIGEKTRERNYIKFFYLVNSLSRSDPYCIFKIPNLKISIDLSVTQVKAKTSLYSINFFELFYRLK
jgi:hypothetical protein